MESKDGRDNLTFSIINSSGAPAGQASAWTPGSRPPWNWPPPRPWRRKKTPCQVKRDQKRKENFVSKKAAPAEVKEKVNLDTKNTANKLVIEFDKAKERQDESVGADLTSPIPQVDGAGKNWSDMVLYSFISDYHQDDILYTLEELFPIGSATLVSSVAPRPKETADQQCTVALKKTAGQDVVWPDMKEDQAQVFRQLALK